MTKDEITALLEAMKDVPGDTEVLVGHFEEEITEISLTEYGTIWMGNTKDIIDNDNELL